MRRGGAGGQEERGVVLGFSVGGGCLPLGGLEWGSFHAAGAEAPPT